MVVVVVVVVVILQDGLGVCYSCVRRRVLEGVVTSLRNARFTSSGSGIGSGSRRRLIEC